MMRKIISLFLAFLGLFSVITGDEKEIKAEFKRLPLPTGRFQVGMKTMDLIDQSRRDFDYPEGRLVPIWIYFPKKTGAHISFPKVLEERARDDFNAISIWKKLSVEVYSEPVLDLLLLKGKRCPVVFLNHGQGCLLSDWGFIAEDLASHGYVVVAIQHQLKTDRGDFQKRFKQRANLDTNAQVIDNLLFVFDYLQKNNEKEFFNAFDTKRVGTIGYSMSANAMILFTSLGYRYPDATLFPHDSKEGVLECVVALDPQRAPFPYHNRYPTFVAFSEKREDDQKNSGEWDFMKKQGLKVVYYKNAHHGSFSDHAYINFETPDPDYKWFDGNTEERRAFFDKLRADVLEFISEKLKKS